VFAVLRPKYSRTGHIHMDKGASDTADYGIEERAEAQAAGVERASEDNTNQRVEVLIDELRQRTSELEQANRELRRVSQYRSLFLARMSHELRTPLTSILGFSEILLDQEQLSEAQRRFCQKIQDSGLQLQTRLNQLVDLSRIEAGQTELFLQEFSVRETVRESCAAAARLAQTEQVRLDYELAPEITTIVSDQGKLRQVLFNFIAWAASRSQSEQPVKILVRLDQPALLSVTISDRGEPVKDIAHVFDPEDTSSPADVNQLGIIIARRLIELMAGSVVLRNRDSGGLEVTIKVPARPPR
jgi:signal transduction histidine kinase